MKDRTKLRIGRKNLPMNEKETNRARSEEKVNERKTDKRNNQ